MCYRWARFVIGTKSGYTQSIARARRGAFTLDTLKELMIYQLASRSALAVIFCTALVTSSLVSGATIVVDVPNVAGTLTYGDPAVSFPFDAGVKFASIDSLIVRIEGTGEEGLIRWRPPQGPFDEAFEPPLSVFLPGAQGAPTGTTADAVWLSDTDLRYEADFAFNVTLLPATLEHLLDGQGELTLKSANAFVTTGNSSFEILDPSVLQLTGAQIIIGGTLAVPAPATSAILLGATGVMLTTAYMGRRRRQTSAIH